jgi:sec-independent protein translocase protein TatB
MEAIMPSLGDSAFIFILALILFGPKKLPELARQLGKLMAEFRRASNEFRMQMEDELRQAEQAEQQQKIAAMEAAAPATPAITDGSENTIAAPVDDPPEIHPHAREIEEPTPTAPLPIASSGDLNLMPPSTGLPVESSSVSRAFDSIPHVEEPDVVMGEIGAFTDRSEGHTPDAPDHSQDHIASEAEVHG